MKKIFCIYNYEDKDITTSCGEEIPMDVFINVCFNYCSKCGKPIQATIDLRRELNRRYELKRIGERRTI